MHISLWKAVLLSPVEYSYKSCVAYFGYGYSVYCVNCSIQYNKLVLARHVHSCMCEDPHVVKGTKLFNPLPTNDGMLPQEDLGAHKPIRIYDTRH